jgi:glc operon protein GlcG
MSLKSAQAMVAGAVARATELNIKVSVAVLDTGGNLVAFARMDGVPPFSVDVAQGKAYGVLFTGRSSAELREMASARPQFFDAIKGLGRRTLVPSPGGIAIPNGGAIGISGAADPDQDVDIAQAAIRAGDAS